MFRDGTILEFESYLIKEFSHQEFKNFTESNPSIFDNDPCPNFKHYYLNDSILDHERLLTTAYSVHYNHTDNLIGYFSLSNIHMKADPSFLGSDYLDYYYIPAVYFQNFAITVNNRKQKHGSNILSILKARLFFNSISAARLIIADSLEQSMSFYTQNGFEMLGDDVDYPTELPIDLDTKRMYFDLLDFKE